MRPHAAALKALLDEPRLQIMPGCGDGMGAHLIEEAGFRTGFISGSSISAMRLAMPDMDLVSFGEMVDAVETCIAAAPNVMWLADGDTGHGNALAVQKVIRTYARRGAAAVLIEDKIWPRPLGHGGAKLVIERDAAVLRCRAAVEACRDEGILLLARTDARLSRGFDVARDPHPYRSLNADVVEQFQDPGIGLQLVGKLPSGEADIFGADKDRGIGRVDQRGLDRAQARHLKAIDGLVINRGPRLRAGNGIAGADRVARPFRHLLIRRRRKCE